MASDGAEQHSENLQLLVAAQVEQLQAALRETMAIAEKQGCGVTVDWGKQAVDETDNTMRMKVDMFVDPDIAVGKVRYHHH